MSNRANCFIKLEHDIVDTAAWLYIAKSGSSKLLIDIWRRHNGKNNGRITYSIRDAQRRFGCSSKTAVMWFRELQELGFIVAEQRGSFSRKTGALDARATRWRLTMERCGANAPTREYLKWAAA